MQEPLIESLSGGDGDEAADNESPPIKQKKVISVKKRKRLDVLKAKQKRRKKKAQIVTREEEWQLLSCEEQAAKFWSCYTNWMKETKKSELTELEIEAQRLKAFNFAYLMRYKDLDAHQLSELGDQCKYLLPNWVKFIQRNMLHKRPDETPCPSLLVVTYSANRATDVCRCLSKEFPRARVFKLFSRHMKVKQQEELLKENLNQLHITVGTPARLLKLCQLNALSLESTLIMIDMSKDVKGMSFFTQKSLKNDFFKLFSSYIQPFMARKKKQKKVARIGLF